MDLFHKLFFYVKIYVLLAVTIIKIKKYIVTHEITYAAMFSYDVTITAEQEELLADLIATYGSEITYITNEIFRKLKWESY